MTINAAESEVVIKTAKEKGVFLMEGKLCHYLKQSTLQVAATDEATST